MLVTFRFGWGTWEAAITAMAWWNFCSSPPEHSKAPRKILDPDERLAGSVG